MTGYNCPAQTGHTELKHMRQGNPGLNCGTWGRGRIIMVGSLGRERSVHYSRKKEEGAKYF